VLTSDTPLGAQSFGALRAADYRLAVPVDRLGPGHYLLTVSISAGSGAVERSMSFSFSRPDGCFQASAASGECDRQSAAASRAN